MKQNNLYEITRNWMYRNARPLELARWKYNFEGGSREEVVHILLNYQNEDGGFGHALEADSWNENSAPIQVFHAIEIIREIGFTDQKHPIIQGILSYLASGKDMEEDRWLSVVPSNNNAPHAPWWEFGHPYANHSPYNPTAGLVGFGLCYAEKTSKLFEECARIAKNAVAFLYQSKELDMSSLNCFIALMEYLEQANLTDIVDLGAVRQKLLELVQVAITKDTSSWATSYVCKPSQFMRSRDSIFYADNKELAEYECKFIQDNTNPEGVWDVTWGWETNPEEWAIAKSWWKGEIVIKNVRYLTNFTRH